MDINLTETSLNNILDNVKNLNSKKVLDIFAREGDWQTEFVVDKVESLEAWEIEQKFVDNFKVNFPNIKCVCRDSIKYINDINSTIEKFDIIIVDNGMNCYGKNDIYCEHFDFIHNLHRFFNDEVCVILNVAKSPFNYNNYPNWKQRREDFYGVKSTDNLRLDFLINFYKELFMKNNFKCDKLYVEPREMRNNNLYLYHFGFNLKRVI